MNIVYYVRPHLVAAGSGIDIGNHGTAIFLNQCRFVTKNDIALVIAEFGDVLGIVIIRMDCPYFEASVVRIKIANIGSVAITKPGRVTDGSIAIQGCGTIDNFIFTIAIQITDNNIEVSLTVKSLTRSFGLVEPALFQIFAIKVVSHHVSCRVVAAGRNQTRVNAIKVSRRRQEAVTTVAVLVAPVETQGIIGAKRPDIARRDIVNRRNLGTVSTPEHRQVFRTRDNDARCIAVILARIPDDLALAVDGAVTGLHDHFGLAVAVVVIDLELRVVRTRTDVLAQVDTPKLCTVKFVRIDENCSRIGTFHGLRIVLVIVRNPFHDKFIFAIAVEIAHAHIVGVIVANCFGRIGHRLACWAVQFENLVRERLAVIDNG